MLAIGVATLADVEFGSDLHARRHVPEHICRSNPTILILCRVGVMSLQIAKLTHACTREEIRFEIILQAQAISGRGRRI